MHFDLIDLKIFARVTECKSITKGAERMHLSLPAVSARIKELEQQSGVRLLYRTPKGVALTPAGQALFQHALTILTQVEHLKDDMQRFGEGVSGHIRIFANTTAVADFMPEVLSQYLSMHPNVDIDLQERLTPEIIRGVLDGTTDLGIISGPVDVEGLERHHFSTDRLMLALPPKHPLSEHAAVKFVDAHEFDFVGLRDGTTLQTFLNKLLRDANKRVRHRVQVNNFEGLCRMVEAGVGIGVVPESAARRHAKTMKIDLKEIDEEWALRERYALTKSGAAITNLTQELIDTLKSHGLHKGK